MAKETRDGDSHHFTAISLADLIQVGGVILGILIGLVSATTDRARFVMTLIICATVLLCGAFYLLFVKRAEWRSRRVVLQVLLSVIMVAVAATYSNSPAQASGNANSVGGVAAGGTPVSAPSIQKRGYVLQPSSDPFTNTQDKIDLDTGCPGWGDMYPHIGPSRCGGLADLIVEQNKLHDANGQPNIIVMPPGVAGTYLSCRALLEATPKNGVNSIQVSSLRDGEMLCVRTDIGNTAVVRLDKVTTNGAGQLTALTIDFEVWTE